MYSWAAIWVLVRPWATSVTSSRSRALSDSGLGAADGQGGLGAVSIRAYSIAVSRLIAVPRSSAVRIRSGPIACRALRKDSICRRASAGGYVYPSCWKIAVYAAQTVTASA